MTRSLISLADLSVPEFDTLIRRSAALYCDRSAHDHPLTGKVIGVLFTLTSTRTRTAFAAGAARLGAAVVTYGPGELQVNTGETVADTARVLGGMLDGIVVRDRTDVASLREFQALAGMPVINAMAREEHPTQGICDVAMMLAHFGTVQGIDVCYLGEGNNSAAALALAMARVPGARLTLATPAGYGLDQNVVALASEVGRRHGTRVEQIHDMTDLPDHADVVYTTQWCTTGTMKDDPHWRAAFAPFTVDERLMGRFPEAMFMHDLPAHRGDEVTGTVLDGPRSLAWKQAHMKQSSAMAVLEWCLHAPTASVSRADR